MRRERGRGNDEKRDTLIEQCGEGCYYYLEQEITLWMSICYVYESQLSYICILNMAVHDDADIFVYVCTGI